MGTQATETHSPATGEGVVSVEDSPPSAHHHDHHHPNPEGDCSVLNSFQIVERDVLRQGLDRCKGSSEVSTFGSTSVETSLSGMRRYTGSNNADDEDGGVGINGLSRLGQPVVSVSFSNPKRRPIPKSPRRKTSPVRRANMAG